MRLNLNNNRNAVRERHFLPLVPVVAVVLIGDSV